MAGCGGTCLARGHKFLWSVLRLMLVANLFSGAAFAQNSDVLSDDALIEALMRGGYNLYVRHAATEWSQSDTIRKHGDWTSCDPKKVRQLSDKGRSDARAVGQAIKSLGIRLARVYSSPYCRTVETARLMASGEVETTHDLMNLRSANFVGGRSAVVQRARARLSVKPAPGTNNLFVAHGNLALAAMDLIPGEGEALIFQPRDDGDFKFVGRLTPQQWVRLADRMQ